VFRRADTAVDRVGDNAVMTAADTVREARQLLVDHTDRALTGVVEDPAVVAAVVGVERVTVAVGSADPATVRAAILGPDRYDPSGLVEVVAEAQAQVVAGLERRAGGEAPDAGAVNADAGRHDIVLDATLLRAAVRAGQRSYDAMPYYRLRYGGRGARFATTDSAWLVALAEEPEERVVGQVRWLSRVLANRGMPSWLLETHLESLVAEVGAVAPGVAVGGLATAAGSLAEDRRAHVGDGLLTRADRWTDDALGPDLPVPHTGLLLAAATADALSGVTRDDTALFEWLTYPERMHPDAVSALRAVRERIRAAAR
jgi:hypothetical protein